MGKGKDQNLWFVWVGSGGGGGSDCSAMTVVKCARPLWAVLTMEDKDEGVPENRKLLTTAIVLSQDTAFKKASPLSWCWHPRINTGGDSIGAQRRSFWKEEVGRISRAEGQPCRQAALQASQHLASS